MQWLYCGTKRRTKSEKRNIPIPNVIAAIKLQEVILLINLRETKQQYQNINTKEKNILPQANFCLLEKDQPAKEGNQTTDKCIKRNLNWKQINLKTYPKTWNAKYSLSFLWKGEIRGCAA